MKKLSSKKNIYHKSVHNLKSKIFHENRSTQHILSKDWSRAFGEMSPIYLDICRDFDRVDMIDFEYYERWLNG